MRRSTYLAIATGLMFGLPAHAQTTTTGKVPLSQPPPSKGVYVPSTTEAGPPQLKTSQTTQGATTTTKPAATAPSK